MRPYGRGVILITPSDTNSLLGVKELIMLSDSGTITVEDSLGNTTAIPAFKGLVIAADIKFVKLTGTTGGISILGIIY